MPSTSAGAAKIIKIKTKIKNYSTEYSHVVPHHSTDSAINCLTAQIGRDAVLLVVYGRNSKLKLINPVLCSHVRMCFRFGYLIQSR